MSVASEGYAGIDIGGTSIRVVIERERGARSEVIVRPVPTSYEDLLSTVPELLAELGAGVGCTVGCGLPGSVIDGVPFYIPALPWIDGRSFAAELGARTGGPVLLAPDGQLALLAESREGAGRGFESAVLITLGTGVGGAVMFARRIWAGAHHGGGAWGWLPGAGSEQHAFEEQASGTALDRLAAALDPGWSAPDLVEAARDGSNAARAVIRRYATTLGRGIAAIVNMLDVEAVILAGGVVRAFDVLEEPLTAVLAAAASPTVGTPKCLPAALGPHAGVLGALRLAVTGESAWL